MLKSLCVLIAFFLMSSLATAEIFKCSKENGKTVYQNFQCDVDSIGSHQTAAPPPNVESVAVSAPDVQRRPARRPRAEDAEAIPSAPKTEPRIGMTKNQVKASTWGEPIDIVKEEVVEGWTQAWYYDLQKKRSVMFDVRGFVSEVSQ